MSACKICARLRRWLGMEPELTCEALWTSHWDQSNAWERANSNQDELWWTDSDRNRALIEEAQARQGADPEAAFQMLLEAAEAGSAGAMESVGWHYDSGTVVTADFDRAADYYRRAICAGSWMATIAYARLLAEHGHFDECENVLRDGVRLDFVAAYFWLAWLRYDRSPTRATCREIRPLLDYAAEQGHPGAKQTLGRLMTKGKFGILAIPRGLKLLRETMPPILSRSDAASADRLKGRALKAAAQE
jgi:TPR repeat protein